MVKGTVSPNTVSSEVSSILAPFYRGDRFEEEWQITSGHLGSVTPSLITLRSFR